MTSVPQLVELLHGNSEFACIDVREEQEYRAGHLLAAVNMPLSRLEQLVGDLIPRRTVPVVVCDAGDGSDLAYRAVRRLAWLGYENATVLAGGNQAWLDAGRQLFAGSNVPSKAFGECVEHVCSTPSITAHELKARLDARDDVLVLDSRPFEEFQKMSIPGGVNCPGAELVHRAREHIASPDTVVVVNCAGRTRSIIGAQSLRNAGLSNPVVALRDGTMGWQLAGFQVEEGASAALGLPSPSQVAWARSAAGEVAQRAGVEMIDVDQLESFRRTSEARTLYVLDVRTPEEYESGHLADSVHAFGGQLIQTTDQFIAVRNSRIVLVDDNEVRALMTASWLRRMGWDSVFVLKGGVLKLDLVKGRRRPTMLGLGRCNVAVVSPEQLRDLLSVDGVLLIDLADPRKYVSGHVPGAAYAVRSQLPTGLPQNTDRLVVVTSSEGSFARLAAQELEGQISRVAALNGGTAAWKAAGFPLETGETRVLHPRIESWSPYDARNRTRESMLGYLAWEVALYDKVARDGSVRFRFGSV